MNNLLDNFICICGHSKKKHRRDRIGDNLYCFLCWDILSSEAPSPKLVQVEFMYHEFKPDNLKYLESIYNAR